MKNTRRLPSSSSTPPARAAAAQRLPLVTMGLLFYMTPVMQLSWGILVGGEPMPPARWLGFALIWAALAVFTADSVRRSRAVRADRPVDRDRMAPS